jgi:DNA-directed RNA polymerase alpha subunit
MGETFKKSKSKETESKIIENKDLYNCLRPHLFKSINTALCKTFFSEVDIDDLDMPKNIKTKLVNHGMKTLADVLQKSEEELYSRRGIEKEGATLYFLKKALKKYSLELIYKY